MPIFFRIIGGVLLIVFCVSVIWFMIWLVSELVSVVTFSWYS